MINPIYKPSGRAQEYAESFKGANDGLAINLYKGCPHSCAYCYVPTMPPWKFGNKPRETFHEKCEARAGLLPALAKQAIKMKGLQGPVHLCFTCDPYPVSKDPNFESITRSALGILQANSFCNVQVLTKGGILAVDDFDLYDRTGWKFGQTIVSKSDKLEPGAAPYESRKEALKVAAMKGIFTWVSMEPVIDTVEALEIIEELREYVSLWKIGKLNHGEEISSDLADVESGTDWAGFLADVRAAIPTGDRIIKKSLLAYDKEGQNEQG